MLSCINVFQETGSILGEGCFMVIVDHSSKEWIFEASIYVFIITLVFFW